MSPEFAASNPAHMWRRPCRYIWAAATTDAEADRALSYWPEIIRTDTWADDGAILRYRKEGWVGGEPTFVPRTADQSPDSSDGVVLVLFLDAAGDNNMVILDAATLAEVAVLHLPVSPMVGGLHNHWSAYPASA